MFLVSDGGCTSASDCPCDTASTTEGPKHKTTSHTFGTTKAGADVLLITCTSNDMIIRWPLTTIQLRNRFAVNGQHSQTAYCGQRNNTLNELYLSLVYFDCRSTYFIVNIL